MNVSCKQCGKPYQVDPRMAGLISPNVLRAAGKYGKHLPIHHKLIAGGFGLVALAICLLLAFVVYPLGR